MVSLLDTRTPRHTPFVGTAGWSIPRASAARCGDDGTHLQRYAQVLRSAEINSSFHRPHRAATYEKWAAATPPGFRFAVKLPRVITHDQKLRTVREPLTVFLGQCAGLGEKLGPLLVQLPPSLAFDRRIASAFFKTLRSLFDGAVVCEPRHATWLSAEAERVLVTHEIARVGADPPRHEGFESPAGWPGLTYFRLHGSPRTYWSSYSPERLSALGVLLERAPSRQRWCIFDNTASGAALENALDLERQLGRGYADPRSDFAARR